jgi:hypothetical protein
MNGLATSADAVGIGFLVMLAAVVLMIWLIWAVLYIFSKKDRRIVRMKAAMTRFGVFLAVVVLTGGSWSYYEGVNVRAAATKFQSVQSDDDGGIYTARYAYLSRDRILLRVYRTSDMALLAERTYRYPDAVNLIWTKDSLIYDTSVEGRDGLVHLPPSMIDRLLARLP